jgi:hypothetical protein
MWNQVLIAYSICVLCAILYLLSSSSSSCVVVITGESVKVINCERVEDFGNWVIKLKPAFHGHL